MECPNCYEVYDDKERIPRNLPCGHTYCEPCLNQIYQIKKKLECPVCRLEVDASIKANNLSKNFVAIEVSNKHREIQKKLQFCSNHSEPLRFFCETCQVNICASCIIDHSGHKFVKQDHSVSLLKQRAKDLKSRINKRLEDIKNSKSSSEECRKNIVHSQTQQLTYIDEEFDRIIARILAKKETLKINYQDACENEVNLLEKEITRVDNSIKDLLVNIEEVDQYTEKLDKIKLVQGDDLHRELNDLEDKVGKDKITNSKPVVSTTALLPKVIFDPLLYKELKHIGILSKDLKGPRICFFGEKNKILIYNVERDEWALTHLSFGEIHEFNYYSSAATLPNGNILITGGGISNAVYQISITSSPSYKSQPQVKITAKPSMHQSRKEHASVFLQDSVYVLGGYDGMMNSFLSSCERFDLETNEWVPVTNMLVPKCAFGATTLANRYIFTLGGYDGNDRLNTIEKYDKQTDKWTVLDVKLRQSLSNSACFSHSDNSIVILGGGYNNGFCLETNQLDINTNTWRQLPAMSDGRDLRNKIVSVGGNVYAIGGNNCLAERFSLKKGEWNLLSSYKEYYDDNLDSWSCALYYDTPRKYEEMKNAHLQNTGIKVPKPQGFDLNNQPSNYYRYNEGFDEDEIFSEGSSENEW